MKGNLFTKRLMKHTQSNLFLDINLIPNGFKGTIYLINIVEKENPAN
jgi:uncharacterized membrane protein